MCPIHPGMVWLIPRVVYSFWRKKESTKQITSCKLLVDFLSSLRRFLSVFLCSSVSLLSWMPRNVEIWLSFYLSSFGQALVLLPRPPVSSKGDVFGQELSETDSWSLGRLGCCSSLHDKPIWTYTRKGKIHIFLLIYLYWRMLALSFWSN